MTEERTEYKAVHVTEKEELEYEKLEILDNYRYLTDELESLVSRAASFDIDTSTAYDYYSQIVLTMLRMLEATSFDTFLLLDEVLGTKLESGYTYFDELLEEVEMKEGKTMPSILDLLDEGIEFTSKTESLDGSSINTNELTQNQDSTKLSSSKDSNGWVSLSLEELFKMLEEDETKEDSESIKEPQYMKEPKQESINKIYASNLEKEIEEKGSMYKSAAILKEIEKNKFAPVKGISYPTGKELYDLLLESGNIFNLELITHNGEFASDTEKLLLMHSLLH